ncbi:MAG: DUF368 domain-containing protein [Phycisphaerales bacterium]
MPPEDAPPTPTRRIADVIGLFLRGFAMGAADVVPGVSGGTIALVTGIYQRFIDALRSLSPAFLAPLAKGKLRAAARDFLAMHWLTLIPIGLGVSTAVATMSGLITGMMESRPGATYAFFFGLIGASAWIPFAQMKSRSWRHGIALVLAAVGAFWLVGLQPQGPNLRPASPVGAEVVGATALYPSKVRTAQDVDAVLEAAALLPAGAIERVAVYDPRGVIEDPGASAATILTNEQAVLDLASGSGPVVIFGETPAPLAWLFVCGVIAISAMMLPGVSGSFLLLFLGQYHAVLSAISRIVHFGLELVGRQPDPLDALSGRTVTNDIVLLGVFNIGVLLGLVLFSRAIGWLLMRAHDLTMAALTGLMIGALRQPMRVMLEDAGRAGGATWSDMAIAAIAGAVIVSALTLTDRAMRARAAA